MTLDDDPFRLEAFYTPIQDPGSPQWEPGIERIQPR